MTQATVVRITCDRCGLTDEGEGTLRWERLSWAGERDKRGELVRSPRGVDLCPDCSGALKRWMAKGKGDTAAAA